MTWGLVEPEPAKPGGD
jgi:hypothetical protein